MKKQTKKYSRQQVLAKCIAYFKGDDLAATTWINKYAMKDREGNILELSPDDMHQRMAKEFARVEKKYSVKKKNQKNISAYGQQRTALSETKILDLFRDFKYVIPQGSVMAALGNPNMVASLSNCVVLPEIFDSYGGICFTDQQLAQLFKRRCGVGIDISSLRPAGMNVSNSAGTTTGAVSFMERFSNTTREVAQNGRRGALMITIDIAHPDIEDFISIKQDLKKVTGANISVRLSDEFMKAVEKDSNFKLRWPVDAKKTKSTRLIKARLLWDKIIACAHKSAEPGLIFWDRQHLYSTSSLYPGFKNVSTNPCSEIAMQGGDSCRLIALNLFSFIDKPFTKEAKFDHKKFYEITYEAQRLMDDLVDLELEAIVRILNKIKSDPEPNHIKEVEIKTWKLLYENGKKGRRTGLGFTALADALAALNLKFDSDTSLAEIENIMRTKCRAEFDSSIDMAIERGAFHAFDPRIEKRSEFVQMMKKEFPDVFLRMMKYGRRNISLSTVAPTGSLSILAQSSSGIEPVFMLSYKRRRKINVNDKTARTDFKDAMGDAWEEFTVYHPKMKQWMETTGKKEERESPYSGAVANDINWEKRVEIQALVQKYTTHSISSTVNLSNNVSAEQVAAIYMQAWKSGLKGITVYREGSRTGVLVSDEDGKNITETAPPKRPKELNAEVMRFMNYDEKWIAVTGLMNDKPYEIFTGKADETFDLPDWVEKGFVIKNSSEEGKKRYDFSYLNKEGKIIIVEGLSRSFNKEYWNYAKLISGVLRHGMPLPHVIDLVENLNLYSDNINTWKAGVVRTLKKFIPDGTKVVDRKCDECGADDALVYEEGCIRCKNCGSTGCG